MSASVSDAERLAIERVTVGAVKAIAGFAPVAVVFGSEGVDPEPGPVVHLAPPNTPLSPPDILVYRGAADAEAVRLRHHDPTIHERLRPTAAVLHEAYDRLAWFRAIALGCRAWTGVSFNLQAWLEQQYGGSGERREAGRAVAPTDALGLMLFGAIAGHAAGPRLVPLADPWRAELRAHAGATFGAAVSCAPDQAAFAEACGALLRAVEPLIVESRRVGSDQRPAGARASAMAAARVRLSHWSALLFGSRPDAPRDPSGAAASPPRLSSSAARAASGRANAETRLSGDEGERYHAYSSAFDEEVRARDLAGAIELTALWQQLQVELHAARSIVSRLAIQLERRLLAKQRRSWDFDQETGLLDASRMVRLLTDPSNHRIFKQPREAPFKNTVVTLLLDNSGSMRGGPIRTAAMCADVLAQVMERCQIRVEVLGFTTTHWDGGPVRERWLANHEPRHPGRLNALRHIVYKAAETPWRRSRQAIALMLKNDLLKENIDGEALLWAHRRLVARPEPRKILIVISDGSPRDESTLSANGRAYLENHLHRVVERIERQAAVHLMAIGVRHDVTRHYRHAVLIRHHEELGGTMLRALADLVDGDKPRRA